MYHKIQFPSPPFSYHICLLVLGLFAGDATVPGMSRALLDRSLAGQRRRQLFVADLRCELLGSLEAGPRIPRTGSSEPIIDLTRVYAPIKLVCLARINWRWSQAFSLASSRLASSFFLLDICAFWPPLGLGEIFCSIKPSLPLSMPVIYNQGFTVLIWMPLSSCLMFLEIP